ncbi:ATP-binding cassette domain-containing protein [Loigolactobacillus coryniformis]|jgi:cobalt/nickel transport system ATP-binding protein|uniref:ABC transporter ATP-binding protein n=3 Tax=Loigolactobacillus coryniformis TaxID=1610 RepID=J3ES66_9LACO|nr:ATP-binding cassette domain-containing protein [Loigolactobacillus coryniformis]MDT3392494.1 ATP-binding cassette domain-containing protein [Bacillota bacterium]OEH89696.1 ABC transporter ATP-binding protein [Loigolactobacillus coryniformis subsp. coryniformis]ATO43148.1 ABC transporter ATP-binding protein [Loigolactobacillus coryniformis subsp. torquens DSM 20004 = KCTC 3535]ATO54904.1 ABC transporter ATP-binding protein [Loigolactobacillus coryniformis subsp. coryniformis KCTC 3167 = DSM 2
MLELQHVNFSYEPGKEVLHDINLKLDQAQVIGIIGPNGSGKSTLFLNLVGIQRPDSGQILLDGQPLRYDKKSLLALRKRIGIVFQNSEQQIFYSLVEDDVAFALHNLGLPQAEIDARVDRALAKLDISDLRQRPIQYLSGGQKKRVAIAGILVLDSEWLLLDEPTAGLDPDGRRRMVILIQQLIANGQKIILSSHDMDFMYEVGQYFYILQDGRIVKSGDKQTVFKERAVIEQAKLEQPWLVRLHEDLHLPLYNTPADLFADQDLQEKLKQLHLPD